MTPNLIEALGRLATLNPAELALVSATASTLAAQGERDTDPPASKPPLVSSRPREDVASRRLEPRHRDGGGLDLLATTTWADGVTVDEELFESAAYRSRVGRTVPTLFYIAGCEGLRALADTIGRTVFKPGVTAGETVGLRLSTLAAARYGACVKRGGRWVEQDGFDFFEAVALPLTRRRGRGSPVQPALRAIAVDRPESLSLAVLDGAVRAGLERASLAGFAETAEAARLCDARRLDPALLQRYTPGPRGAGARIRPTRATELAVIGPRSDADNVAALLERIIADHVMLSNH